MSANILLALFVLVSAAVVSALELKAGAYNDFVFQINDNVPFTNCKSLLTNLETTITSSSDYLHGALNGRAFLRSVTIYLPPSWPEECYPGPVIPGSGDTSDVTIVPRGPSRGRLWTQQSAGCGQSGDQIFLSYESLRERDDTMARSLIKEFAMYRYGVFEEQGYSNDPVYPICYTDDETHRIKVTGCSDLPINDNGVCHDNSAPYNTTNMVDINARSSIMFAPEAVSVSMFCDEGNHEPYAPTKHNLMCQRRSTLDVILNHSDFNSLMNDNITSMPNNPSSGIVNTTPKITYKKQTLTRYVLIIENTRDMAVRESWIFLRKAISKWAVLDLQENTEVGVVLTDVNSATRRVDIMSFKTNLTSNGRDTIASNIPYSPADARSSHCLHCAIKEATKMLQERNFHQGPANSIILVIAPGMDDSAELKKAVDDAKKSRFRIATINYPSVTKQMPLDSLAQDSDGVAYTVLETKYNVDSSFLSTYFRLTNVLYSVATQYYQGNPSDMMLEIHRRELTDDGRTSVTGSFTLDETMGEQAQFRLYTHNTDNPLIKSMKLTSPSQRVFDSYSDRLLPLKIMTLVSNINETGTWTYTIERYSANPQPHFLQVMATPRTKTAPVVRAKFWVRRDNPDDPLVLYTEVKRGDWPVLGAKVEVIASKPEGNGSIEYKERFELLDTGSGDPDITKGDGIYSRYFSAATGGPGMYTFEVFVTDNGNTAYGWQETYRNYENEKPCCGSVIPADGVQPLTPFQRVLPPRTVFITSDQIVGASNKVVGRIGDLRVQVIPEDMKARLIWTAPDMGGVNAAHYEVKYGYTIKDIADRFETAQLWDIGFPFPLAAGSETTFTLDMNQQRELLDKPLYFAIRAYQKPNQDTKGPVSNWVRVLVPSPPPPPTVAPTYSSNHDLPSWPNVQSAGVDSVVPSIAKNMNMGIELILPIIIGVVLLAALLTSYCYFCVVKRKNRNQHKKPVKNSNSKSDKLSASVTIVPSSPTNTNGTTNQQSLDMSPAYTNQGITDHHTVGVPLGYGGSYDDEPKKRYSLVHQQEQQLIEELKQQQQLQQRELMQTPNNNYGGLSIISTATLTRNGRTLSPYESWTASQLLHEHERRHSPLDDMMPGSDHHQDLMNATHMEQNMDHLSMSGRIQEMNGGGGGGHPNGGMHIAPPVPPLPQFNSNGYPVNYSIYGVHPSQQQLQGSQALYQALPRNEPLVPFNPSLQGSMSSVNSGEKKRRNVTMV